MGNSKVLFVVLLILLGFFEASIIQVKASGDVLTVDANGTGVFTSIQEAVDAANADDTVFVRAGTYYEHISIGKPLSLIGEDASNTFIDAGGAVGGARPGLGGGMAIQVIGVSNVNITGFTIRYADQGIYLGYSPHCRVSNNIFDYCDYAVLIASNGENGENVIESNQMNFCPVAVYITYSVSNFIYNNFMDHGEVYVNAGYYTVLKGNTIRGLGRGIELTYCSNNIVEGNTFEDISEYTLVLMGYGANPPNNKIFHNNFINSGPFWFSIHQSSFNTWDDGYPSGGNYWSNYQGSDVMSGPLQDQPGSDGIGDTAVEVNPENIDHYPLMHLFTHNPKITIVQPTAYGVYNLGIALQFSASDSLNDLNQVRGILTNFDGTTILVESGYVPPVGVYSLVVEASDQASNVATSEPISFVVYDPNGGFAAGNGRFYPDETSTLPSGIARFGFEVKYKDSASAGNLQFVYKDADIDLRSDTIDWLVISSTKVLFQGTGMINNNVFVTFRATAEDGLLGTKQDAFSIKIWLGTDTEASPIHTAQNVISAGNIIVRKK